MGVFVVLGVGAALTSRAGAEEQDVGPVANDALYVVSPHGGHVATIGHKGSRFAVLLDGVAGPKFDEIMTTTNYVDARTIDLTQSVHPLVVFSLDGKRYAYAGRVGQEVVVIADGKELMRVPLENQSQVEIPMQFSGEDGKHLFVAFSGPTGYALWVDGQKMPGTYNPSAGPIFSPDGERFAYVGQISRDKATVVVDGKEAGYAAEKLEFSADGHHLFAVVRQGNAVWLALDGKPKIKTDGINQLVMTPAGNGFAAILQRLNPPGVFLVINAKKIEGSDCPGINQVIFSPDGHHFAALCSASPSVKYVLADGKKGQEYFDVPGLLGMSTLTLAYSADSSKLAYVARTSDKYYVVVNDDESDGIDSNAQFNFSADGKHLAYGGIRLTRPFIQPVVIDGQPEQVNAIVAMPTFIFSPDGSRHAYDAGGATFVDGKNTGVTGVVLFSPDSHHVAISGRRGADNKAGLFVDGKLVYQLRSNYPVHYLAFTPDSQHLFWVVYETPKDPTTSQGDFVSYLDGKPVASYEMAGTLNAQLDPSRGPQMVKLSANAVAGTANLQSNPWRVEPDGTLIAVGPVGATVKRFTITPTADTSITAMVAAAK